MDLITSLFNLKNNISKKRSDKIFQSKLQEFEELLGAHENLDEHTACLLLYGKKNITTTFRSLKYRLEEKLMNDIFNLCSGEEYLQSRVSASFVIEKMTTISLTLQKHFYRNAAIKLMEKTLKLAKKYSFVDQVLKLMVGLLNHYSYIEPNELKMKKYIKDTEYYMEVYKAEKYIERCNAIIGNMYLMKKGGFNAEQIKEMEQMIIDMNLLKDKYTSNNIVLLTNDLTYFYYQSIGNHKKGLEVATHALQETLALKVNEAMGVIVHKQNIAVSNFYLKNYEQANVWFLDLLNAITPGVRNWFLTSSLYYLNIICQKNYEELYNFSVTVLNNKNISKFPYYEEQWRIREAYLHFLIKLNRVVVPVDNNAGLKPFSVNKFMNSVPLHSKDKSGQNISIIVLQMLFLLAERKYSKIIDKMDALTQYSYRYLKKDETFRSNCFIKMLILTVKADFHPVRTQQLTAELRKKMNTHFLISDEKSAQVEIIPYEHLWELVIELLEKNY